MLPIQPSISSLLRTTHPRGFSQQRRVYGEVRGMKGKHWKKGTDWDVAKAMLHDQAVRAYG